ncbi:hypothetical protein GCM10011409_21170 [Lentibacillus populi]|uniref:Uncharacterized protein n=1 Tax=Lentibacillus populi TaxID=1827502 RepID=A0A9W5TY12_9BACI|nr:hypothetical protein GCM10011409_21170 [Lentibacillus populi]
MINMMLTPVTATHLIGTSKMESGKIVKLNKEERFILHCAFAVI